MRTSKRIYLILLSLLLIVQVVSLSACTTEVTNNNGKGDSAMNTLNERQISICEDLGLPSSYEKLTTDQQIKITRIEELLQYLDEKYNDTFYYVGYYEPFMGKERLEAYTGQFNEYEFVTLTVQDDGSYTDDYPFVFAKRLLRSDLVSFLDKETGFSYKAYVITGDTSLTDLSDIDMDAISGKTWVSLTVFVSGERNSDDAKKIGETIGDWYKQNAIYGSTNVVAVGSEAFDAINFENYQSVKREQGVDNLVSCDVSSSGEVEIH